MKLNLARMRTILARMSSRIGSRGLTTHLMSLMLALVLRIKRHRENSHQYRKPSCLRIQWTAIVASWLPRKRSTKLDLMSGSPGPVRVRSSETVAQAQQLAREGRTKPDRTPNHRLSTLGFSANSSQKRLRSVTSRRLEVARSIASRKWSRS
jgi:hypothetical protein